jgi:hypothetical protein
MCVVRLTGSHASQHFVGGEAFERDRIHKVARVTLQDSSGRHEVGFKVDVVCD